MITFILNFQEKALETKVEEVLTLKRSSDDYEKLKREMKSMKDKMNRTQHLRVSVSKGDISKCQSTCAPPSTPARKQVKTGLGMIRPSDYNESPEVITV